jgi:hypothetical protein
MKSYQLIIVALFCLSTKTLSKSAFEIDKDFVNFTDTSQFIY